MDVRIFVVHAVVIAANAAPLITSEHAAFLCCGELCFDVIV